MRRLGLTVLLGIILGAALEAQGTLSNQVLQLLTRVNTWTATNTFLDLRIIKGVPSDTVNRFYADSSGALYFNGNAVTAAGGATLPHNLLSTTHPDTVAAAATRGAVVVGNATPKWAAVALCPSGNYLGSNGTDTVCATSAANFTAIPGAQITGTIAAVSGVNLTSLNASNLASGTVPTGRLTGVITNTEVNAAAAIAYSKLNLATSIVNADVAVGAAIVYSKLLLTGSIVTGDLTAATLLFDRFAQNGAAAGQVPRWSGAAWVAANLGVADVTGAGTVSSVTLAMPTIFSVAGATITTTGTHTVTLATEVKNLVWAGPASGADAAPTFRALVVADLPTITSAQVNNTIALTGTDINTSNQVTATHLAAALPMAQGGTGVAVAADDTLLVGSGAAWVAQTMPNCVAGALNYTQATNAFSCNTTPSTHNLLSATHSDTLADTVVRGDLIVGNSTPKWARLAKGAAGTLLTMGATDPSWSSTVAMGTITASTPLQVTQTWNAVGTTFTGILANVTNTASAAASLLLDLQKGGTSQFSVSKSGTVNALSGYQINGVAVTPSLRLTNTSAYTAISNTNVESYFGTGAELKIPAGFIGAAGQQIVLDLRGVYGVNGATDTMTLKVKICTVSGCGSGTVTTLISSHAASPGGAETNRGWLVDGKCNVFTVGAGGTMDCQGFLIYGISTINANPDDMLNTSTVAIDTTVDQYVSASVTFNNTSVSNTITLRSAAVRVY